MKRCAIYVCNRLWLILIIYLTSLFLASYLFSIAETKSFIDAFWWACVTSLTVGYGDMYPTTFYGRLVGILFGHFWIFAIIPTIIANIIFRLIEDKDKWTDEEQRHVMNKLDEILLHIKLEQKNNEKDD